MRLNLIQINRKINNPMKNTNFLTSQNKIPSQFKKPTQRLFLTKDNEISGREKEINHECKFPFGL